MTAGVVIIGLALLGWLATLIAVPILQRPHSTEDLTAVWTQAGPTPLGQSTSVTVPPGQTFVAFLVGTSLYGGSGTTTGSCTASEGGQPVRLSGRVQIERSLTGVLDAGQETVAIAGWNNATGRTVRLEVVCRSDDSTVQHYVAVPSRTAVLTRQPWFQPWGWVAVAVVGVALVVMGVTSGMGAGLGPDTGTGMEKP